MGSRILTNIMLIAIAICLVAIAYQNYQIHNVKVVNSNPITVETSYSEIEKEIAAYICTYLKHLVEKGKPVEVKVINPFLPVVSFPPDVATKIIEKK